ncbi:MAG: GIY-YIG nuclease family protein [Pseudohongiellaceae bacterium]
MIDFDKELESILMDDPLGLLDVKPKPSSAITADARLITSFEEINAYINEHGHAPTASRDIKERRLYSRLKGLRDSPDKAAALAKYDSHGLLSDVVAPVPKEINTIDDILEDDVLGLLDSSLSSEADPTDIFTLRNVPKSIEMPDHIAKRKPCEEFDEFEPLFKRYHADLSSGIKTTRKFESELQIAVGEMFILQGMLVYVANVGEKEKRNFGNVNARLYCVFENGTESKMLLRSLAAAFWKDEHSRQIVDANQSEMFVQPEQVGNDDKPTGYIYVLRTLSNDPKIKELDDLYKIGFSSQPTRQRIQNAAQEPTYLMADVEVVSEFQTYNLNPQKLELLLHTFFAESCLNFDIFDKNGARYTPREWFVVPLHIIETALKLLINGEIFHYRYDSKKQEILPKSS